MMPTAIISRRARRRGQSAVLVAVVLPFLMAFTLLVVEVAERWLEVAMLEDALQQATRSTVQLLDYAALARAEGGLRAGECRAVTATQNSPCKALLATAQRFLLINLTGVRGLAEPAADLVARVRWTVLPRGGTCSYSSTAIQPVTETTPLICAEVRPQMRGIVGWGAYRPLITAADTLDAVAH
jgi:Flp pilus assembly protein TadG